MKAMREKIEEIAVKTKPEIVYQLVKLKAVEDWIAYIHNLQFQGFMISSIAWRVCWGDSLYYIVLGMVRDTRIKVVVEVKNESQKELAYYYISNVLRVPIRDKGLDELFEELRADVLLRR